MKFTRIWAMPNSETFKIEPIKQFDENYLRKSKRSIDPFARNTQMATLTNDINKNVSAQYCFPAHEFISKVEGSFDLCIYDPPYSVGQVKECYQSAGIEFSQQDAQDQRWRKLEKDLLAEKMPIDSVFLHFGWHTNGMGKERGFEIEEILIVAHGGGHNDTLCMAERRITKQENLFLEEEK